MNKVITKDTILIQGDKSYPAIKTKQGIVWIDKDAEIKQGDWYIDFSLDKPSLYQMKYKQWGEEGQPNCKKIIAANFELEGVPKIELEDEIEVEELARQWYMTKTFNTNNPNQRSINGFIAGYKANQTKYTEEDMKKAVLFGINSTKDCKNLYRQGLSKEEITAYYLQSLNSITEITVDENFKQI